MQGGKYLYRSYGADKRRAGRRGGSFSVAAAVAVVCVFSAIAVNALSPSDLLIYMPCRPCYAVCMGVFDNGAAAEKFALLLKERGGAGYVLSDGGRFLTLAAAYGSEADAVKVSDRLKEEGENASVIDLSLKAENISFGGEARLAKLCVDAADMIYRAFLELTVIADKIDAAAPAAIWKTSPPERKESPGRLRERRNRWRTNCAVLRKSVRDFQANARLPMSERRLLTFFCR